MNRLILFTPIGGTDPISMSNFCDGAFLHICRVYKPTDVIMYMSAEILTHHEKDNRYLYCLDKLCEHLGHQIKPHIIECRDLIRVYEFDWFYEEFRKIFTKIFREIDDSDTVLVNISSGTPAMKSGLSVLMTMGEYPAKLIQVTTPDKKMNTHDIRGYDVKALWELDPDNDENFENRCHEISCPNLSMLKNVEIIKKQINCYDYNAAVMIAEEFSAEYTENYIDLIRAAAARKMLDQAETDRLFGDLSSKFIPIREGNKRACFEYALILDIKQNCGEYTDFLRALSPLIAELFELALNEQFNIDVDKYCRFNNRKKYREWDREALNGTEIIEILNKEYSDFRYGPVYAEHLKTILDAQDYSRDGGKLIELKDIMEDLRQVEIKVRNPVAHEIICIHDEDIRRKTGFYSSQIMDKIKKSFQYTGIKVKKEYWNSYDNMNNEIIKKISGN